MKYYAPISYDDMKTLTDLLNTHGIFYELRASNGILIEQSALRKLSPEILKEFEALGVVPEASGSPITYDEKHGMEMQMGSILSAAVLLLGLFIGVFVWWLRNR